jgi:hypothetical protein
LNIGFDALIWTVMTGLCVLLLVVSAALLYVIWLCLRLDREVRRCYRSPEVERDGHAKPIRERR